MKLLTFFFLSFPLLLSFGVPNVIYIKTDDQRYDALSMTGHPVTQTPHIDKLAREGVFFDQAFITSPICGPSRANTFTAQWERKNRHCFGGYHGNPLTEEAFKKSWITQLKNAGYFTGYVGKHHVDIHGNKNRRDLLRESLDFAYYKKGHLGFHLQKSKSPVFSNLKNNSQVEGLLEATEAFLEPTAEREYFFDTAHASVKDFLKKRSDGVPFALSINLNLPHASSIGGMGAKGSDPEYYKSLYGDQLNKLKVPEDFTSPEPLPEEVFQRSDLMSYYVSNTEAMLQNKMLRMARANYAIDLFVGSLREHLSQLGVADNTIIIYASDHGLMLGEKGLGGKSFLFEESVRIPMIVYSPFFTAEKRGKVSHDLVVGQDIPATILELCGIDIPESYQGESVLPLINGNATGWRNEVFLENLFTLQGYPRMEAVRTAEWKYIRYFSRKDDRGKYLPDASIQGEPPIFEQLFHLSEDPKEQHNLAALAGYAKVLSDYRERCQRLVTELAQ